MGFFEQVLDYDRARAARGDAPVPATGGRRIVCLVCTEVADGVARRFGLDPDQVVVVAVPGPRAARHDGDVARGVALAAAAAAGSLGGAEVIVLGHDGCSFRAPSFAVPGPSVQGESVSSAAELVASSVAHLRASPWMARQVVHGIVVDASGRLQPVREDAVRPSAPGPAGGMMPSGPVSFFGGPGAAPSLAGPSPVVPVAQGGPVPPGGSPAKQGPVPWDAIPAIGSLGSTAPNLGTGPRIQVGRAAELPSVGAPPSVSAPPPGPTFDIARPGELSEMRVEFEPEPPPPPKPAKAQHGKPPHPRNAPPPPPQPAQSGADDPFQRAEAILEKLRRERRK